MNIAKTSLSASVEAAVVLATVFASPASANLLTCSVPAVTVAYQQKDHAALICDAVAQSVTLFEQCNVPALSGPVHITLVEDTQAGCVALYHCGEGRIDILTPSLMQERRTQDGAFAHVVIEDYFKSVVVHELAHVATDAIPCPVDNCVTSAEYIAYAMQVLSLSSENQSTFAAMSGLERTITSDEINAMILYMDPHLFSQKVWAHFQQRARSCDYIARLVDGSVVLDFEEY